MKRTNLAKKLTAIAMTGVMVMSMGMTAFAADGITGIDVKKTVTTDGNTYAPNTTFTFTIAEGEADTVSGKTVYAGVADGLTMSEGIEFTADSNADTAAEYIKSGAITVDATKFTTPGIYHYVVSETEGTYEGITYDKTSYDLYVYVENVGGEIKVAGVTASIPEGEGKPEKATEIAFTNDYGKTNDMVHSVLITKEVTGNQGDKTKGFSFFLSVDGDEGELYKVVYTNQMDEETVSYLTSGAEAASYTLKNDESLQIYGLSAGDTYTVTEADYSGDGYTTTVNEEETNTKTGTTAEGNVTVAFKNNKNVTTPTGIAMTFAPYALMVVFAGVFAVMFLRKKREDF